MGERVFVTAIRPETNEVVIGSNQELFTDKVLCRDLLLKAKEMEFPDKVIGELIGQNEEYVKLSLIHISKLKKCEEE